VERDICPIATSTLNVLFLQDAWHMHETAIFPLPVYNLTSPSCSLTLISFKTRKFRRLYCVFFIAHARNGHIPTSGLKSDVTIAFLDPDFLSVKKNVGHSRTIKVDIGLLNIRMGYQDLLA